jgi:hypothetical protein
VKKLVPMPPPGATVACRTSFILSVTFDCSGVMLLHGLGYGANPTPLAWHA